MDYELFRVSNVLEEAFAMAGFFEVGFSDFCF